MLDFVNKMISDLLSPISRVIFPEWYGSGLDSHKVKFGLSGLGDFRQKMKNLYSITFKFLNCILPTILVIVEVELYKVTVIN